MKLYKYKSLPHKKELTAEEKEQLEYCKDILLNHRLFMAPRETLNDPFEGMAIPKLNQSKDFSYCGRRDIETNDDYEEYYVTKAFISEENLKKFKASLEQ